MQLLSTVFLHRERNKMFLVLICTYCTYLVHSNLKQRLSEALFVFGSFKDSHYKMAHINYINRNCKGHPKRYLDIAHERKNRILSQLGNPAHN